MASGEPSGTILSSLIQLQNRHYFGIENWFEWIYTKNSFQWTQTLDWFFCTFIWWFEQSSLFYECGDQKQHRDRHLTYSWLLGAVPRTALNARSSRVGAYSIHNKRSSGFECFSSTQFTQSLNVSLRYRWLQLNVWYLIYLSDIWHIGFSLYFGIWFFYEISNKHVESA